jgi:hypothetical protein
MDIAALTGAGLRVAGADCSTVLSQAQPAAKAIASDEQCQDQERSQGQLGRRMCRDLAGGPAPREHPVLFLTKNGAAGLGQQDEDDDQGPFQGLRCQVQGADRFHMARVGS